MLSRGVVYDSLVHWMGTKAGDVGKSGMRLLLLLSELLSPRSFDAATHFPVATTHNTLTQPSRWAVMRCKAVFGR